MISFNYELDFKLTNEECTSEWIKSVINAEEYEPGEINYIFCDDAYLLKLNIKFLNHNTLTDIISFDYNVGKEIHGDIFISVDRVKENASKYNVPFQEELNRVIVHGVLHFCGYNDKSIDESKLMRDKENYYIEQFKENM